MLHPFANIVTMQQYLSGEIKSIKIPHPSGKIVSTRQYCSYWAILKLCGTIASNIAAIRQNFCYLAILHLSGKNASIRQKCIYRAILCVHLAILYLSGNIAENCIYPTNCIFLAILQRFGNIAAIWQYCIFLAILHLSQKTVSIPQIVSF